MTLTNDQMAAMDKFVKFIHSSHLSEMVIEGFPGTGKSYLIKELFEYVSKANSLHQLILGHNNRNINIVCTATTNKAAKVLKNFVGVPTKTIHSHIGLKVNNNIKTGKTYVTKGYHYSVRIEELILIDEANFIDCNLLKEIKDACVNCKLVFIGDPYQLTPVGSGKSPVFEEIKYKVKLNEFVRFDEKSNIAILAESYRKTIDTGVFYKNNFNSDCTRVVSGDDFKKLIINEFRNINLSNNSITSAKAKILSWSNLNVTAYNDFLKETFTKKTYFEVDEYVITNKPIKEIPVESVVLVTDICLGTLQDIPGYWIKINNKHEIFQAKNPHLVQIYLKKVAKEVKKSDYPDWLNYFTIKDQFGDLRAMYACTIHKSQGSTYDTVYINLNDIGRCNQPITVARLLHVAITRAKKEVIFYGKLPSKYLG